MFTRKSMALAAAGLLSLALIPAISIAKPAAKHAPVAAHAPVVTKAIAKKPVAVAHKKPVAKKVVKKGHGKTVAAKHGKTVAVKHGKKAPVKHVAHKPVKPAVKAVAHKKTIAAKPVVVTPPPMF